MTKVMLCSLVLNESEWLDKNYQQHCDWPGLVSWVFVHGADLTYSQGSPEMVTKDGFSVDDTRDILDRLTKMDPRVTVVNHGWMTHPINPDQGKIQGRNRYMDIAGLVKPELLLIIDADEFYSREHQAQVVKSMMDHPDSNAFILKRREIWRPPSIADRPLFELEVKGGFWDIPCCHWWRWQPNLRYTHNHNTPMIGDTPHGYRMRRIDRVPDSPEMIHLGFASQRNTRLAKNRYYETRGEGTTDRRGWYVQSREAWGNWRPGMGLPHGARVENYTGVIPEVFR